MCDNFRDNEWKPLPPLDDEDKDTLFKALNMAVTHTVRSELDAETEDDRKYYLEQEAKLKNLTTKLFDPKKHTPWWKPQSPKESKWRPLKTFSDFIAVTQKSVGTSIVYRTKIEPEIEVVSIVQGFGMNNKDELAFIDIGICRLEPEVLFKNFEFKRNGLWYPFGVEE